MIFRDRSQFLFCAQKVLATHVLWQKRNPDLRRLHWLLGKRDDQALMSFSKVLKKQWK